MKSKGFTLVELIGVIVLLGLLAAFSIPALTKTFKKSADKEYEEFIKNITLATENYFHSTTNGEINSKVFVTIKELSDSGYLKKTVNPLTNTNVSDDATIVITKNADGTENYEFVDQDLTVSGYVQEGLVLLYDGYSDIVDNKIIDLSENNYDGTIHDAIKENNYYYLDSADDYVLSNIPLDGTNLTIEICYDYISGSYIFKTDAGTPTHIYEKNLLDGSAASFITTKGLETKTLKYYTQGSNKYLKNYLNGIGSDSNTVADLLNGTYITLGTDDGNSAKVKIYSIRIYSRSLTDTEIKQNYIVDKYRFGIGESHEENN